MSRKTVDCRAFPNEIGCTLTISGEEEEVLAASAQHAVAVHGHTEPREELLTALRGILQDELVAAHANQTQGGLVHDRDHNSASDVI